MTQKSEFLYSCYQMAANTDIQKVPQAETGDFQKTSMSIPADLHLAVRIEAMKRRMDAQDLWVEAMRRFLNLPATN